MKKLICIISCIILTINLSAQLHYFLPRDNAVMSILDQKYWFEGDTIINDIRYTKVYRQYCSSETECSELQYYAAVREDTIGAKIYCIQTDDGIERLIANFNVQANDKIEIYSYWPWLSKRLVTVDSVDFVLIDEQYRKRVNIIKGEYFWNDYPPDVWVEGIGSVVYGLFFPSPEGVIDLGDVPRFLCLHINGELLYQDMWAYGACFLPDNGVAIPSIKLSEDKIYYFIENEQLYLQKNYTYRIYDVHGSLVLSGIHFSNVINISQLATGIFFIRLYHNGKPVYSDKFVKY